MGSNAIVTVLGFLIVFTIVDLTMNKGNLESYDNTFSYSKHVTSRDIARNSIQVALRKIDTDTALGPGSFPVTGSLNGGTFNVAGTIVNDSTINLVAVGTFMDSNYNIKTTLVRHHIPFDSSYLKAALGIHPSPLGVFNMNGSKDTVDGRDHDLTGRLLPLNPPVAGIQMSTTTDSVVVAGGIGVGDVLGSPPLKVDPTVPDPDTSASRYKMIADFYYTNSKKGKDSLILNTTWGSPTHPVIVYCDGADVANFKMNNCTGWGILVVDGGLTLQSNVTWTGLVISFSKTTGIVVNVGQSNYSTIIGGVIMGGLAPGSSYTLGGNTSILYSSAALRMAQQIETPYVYEIRSWYEGYF